jgi:hypothetical protein
MIGFGKFKIVVDKLDRRITCERALDDFLNKCLVNDVNSESHQLTIKELLDRYMSVVRSRNEVRRNWHPNQARACDLETLQWIAKDMFKSSLEKRLRKALVTTRNGKKVITEESIQKIVHDAADELYESKRKNLEPSSLEKIVRQIHRWNPEVTDTDVINEMKSTPEKFGIVVINETDVVIRVPKGVGKQYEDKPRSLATIKNILTRIKTPKQ